MRIYAKTCLDTAKYNSDAPHTKNPAEYNSDAPHTKNPAEYNSDAPHTKGPAEYNSGLHIQSPPTRTKIA